MLKVLFKILKDEKTVVEAEFSAGAFWMILSMIKFCISVEGEISISTDKASEAASRNGVKFLLSPFSLLISS